METTTVMLAIVLTLAGQKPTSLNLDMPDVKTCFAEADRFMTMNQPENKPHVIYRAAGCMVGTPEPTGLDTKN